MTKWKRVFASPNFYDLVKFVNIAIRNYGKDNVKIDSNQWKTSNIVYIKTK